MEDYQALMRAAGTATKAVKTEAEAEGIALTDGGAYRLAYVALSDVVQQYEEAVDTLEQVRLYAEKMVRSADPITRISGADIKQILEGQGGQPFEMPTLEDKPNV